MSKTTALPLVVYKIGFLMAISLVISSMVGTGIFTSLGFQVVDITSAFAIIMLWVLGGIIAFCGAVVYAELGASLPRSGGEYHILSKLYHPLVGFLAGWVSATVGFAAPASIAAIALSAYLGAIIPALPQTHFSAFIIVAITAIHCISFKFGESFQNAFTLLKVILMLVLIAAGFSMAEYQPVSLVPTFQGLGEIFSGPFAISLVFVLYAYTGWNSSIYVVGEIEDPLRNLPKSLFYGTLIVMLLYILLNYVFLLAVPMETLKGQVEIGFLVGNQLYGAMGAAIVAILISILLLSTVSAYVFLGPRVIQVMGEDFHTLRWLAQKSRNGVPINAFLFSGVLSLVFIYTSTFEQVLVYTSFLLILITTLTVGGIFILRKKYPSVAGQYRAWGYPFTPIFFLVVNIWVMFYVLKDKFFESVVGFCILLVGSFLFYLTSNKKNLP